VKIEGPTSSIIKKDYTFQQPKVQICHYIINRGYFLKLFSFIALSWESGWL